MRTKTDVLMTFSDLKVGDIFWQLGDLLKKVSEDHYMMLGGDLPGKIFPVRMNATVVLSSHHY